MDARRLLVGMPGAALMGRTLATQAPIREMDFASEQRIARAARRRAGAT